MKRNVDYFKDGLKDSIPLAIGYFSVAFTLGIAARNAGLTPLQGFLSALLLNASAGQYAVYSLFESNAPFVEVVLVTLVVNARYILMSLALSQRVHPDSPMRHRFLISLGITDELFGLSIADNKFVQPYYYYRTMTSLLWWAIGNFIGVIAGNILPLSIVSALSVALYGMFIAAVIPSAKVNRTIAFFVVVSYVASFTADVIGLVERFSSGIVTIVLTVIIASVAAIRYPIEDEVIHDE